MRTRPPLFALLGLTLLCGAADAQPWGRRPPGDEPPPGGPSHRLFISPSGEPFRQEDAVQVWFTRADTNHDGALSREEFRADALQAFSLFDQNGDGVIDGFETARYENEIAPEISHTFPDREPPRGGGPGAEGGPPPSGRGGEPGGRRRGPDGGGSPAVGGRREGAARFSHLDIPEPIRAADLNLDWKVTREEWLKAADKRFAMLDVKALGRLTLEDLPPLPDQGPPGERPRRPPR